MTGMQEKYADKIAKLLSKAESTTSEEAEALIAKAQELMMQYAIEQAMVDAARGIERDAIEQRSIHFTGNYRRELLDLAWNVAHANNCLGVQCRTTYDDGGRKAVKVYPNLDGSYSSQVTGRKKALRLDLTGFRSDLENALILESSLRLQAISAMTTWWKDNKRDWETYARKVKIRSEFLESFASAVYAKLQAAAKVGENAAIRGEAVRAEQSESEAGASVALVLRGRKDRVQDWYDKHYGKSLRKSRHSYRSASGTDAYSAGYAAGSRADIGQPRIGHSQELNR